MKSVFLSLLGLASACVVTGCGQTEPGPVRSNTPDPKARVFVLASEPAGAKNVIEVKQNAKDGDEVVILGRIGGSETPFSNGRVAFTIVDTSFITCDKKPGDEHCKTPWDYCCDPLDELAKGTVLVKFVDLNGKTLLLDAKELLSVKESQLVVVKGHIRRDEGNSISVVATGIFIKG